MFQPSMKTSAKPIGLTDWAYEAIKDSILNLAIQPGAQLQIEQLAARLDISRTPVREALLRLERDGFVQVVPRVGFFVTGVDPQDLDNLYEIRELLESRAVKDAIPRLTDGELVQLSELLAVSARAVDEGDLEKFLETEIRFHTFLTDHSHNPRLIAIIDSFRDLTYRWRKLSITSVDDVRESLEEHRQIYTAAQRRDADTAGRLMSEHICAAKGRITRIINRLNASTAN